MPRLVFFIAVVVSSSPASAQDAKDPNIGLDYRALVRDQMRLVVEGKAKEAVDFLSDRAA